MRALLWRAVPVADLAAGRFVTRDGPRLPRPFSIRMMLSAPCLIFLALFTTFSSLRLALRRPVLRACAWRPVPARPRSRPMTVPLRRVTSPLARCEPRADFERDAVLPGVRPREDAPLLLVRLLEARAVRAERSLRSLEAPARLARADEDRLELVEAARRERLPEDRDEAELRLWAREEPPVDEARREPPRDDPDAAARRAVPPAVPEDRRPSWRLARLSPAARFSAVSRPISLLKLLAPPLASSSCTSKARLLSSNFWNHSSQPMCSSDCSPL
jgi:hypothetical protein